MANSHKYFMFAGSGIVLVAAAILYLPTLGSYGIWDPWEPLWAQTAREMKDLDVWVIPVYREDPRMIHPPFVYWIIRICYSVLGITEFAARLPVALVSIFGCIATYFALRNLVSHSAGIYSAFIWMTTPLFNFLSRQSTVDAVFCVVLNMVFLAFVCSVACSEKRKLYVHLFYVFLSISVLTKGPFALFVVLVFLGMTSALHRDLFPWRAILSPTGILLFLILTLPWFLAAWHQQGQEFIGDYFSYKTQIRFTEGTGSHNHGIFYYFRTLPFAFFPWAAVYLPAVFFLLATRKRIEKQSGIPDPVMLFLIVTVSVFGVYSIFPAKIHHFILPVIPSMAWISGIFFDRITRIEHRSEIMPYFLSTFICFAVIAALWHLKSLKITSSAFLSIVPLLMTFTVKGTIPHQYEPGVYLSLIVGLTGLLFILVAITRSRYVLYGLIGCIWLSCMFFNHEFIPEISRLKTMKHLVASYMKVRREGEPIAMVGTAKNSVFFYTNNEIERIKGSKTGTRLVQYLMDDRRVFAIMKRSYAEDVREYMKSTYHADPVVVDNSHMSEVLITNKNTGLP